MITSAAVPVTVAILLAVIVPFVLTAFIELMSEAAAGPLSVIVKV